MKKILFLVIAVVVVSGMLLISCGEETPTPTPTATTPTPTATTPTPTATTPTPTATTPTPTATPTVTPTSDLGDLARPEGGNFGGRLQFVMGSGMVNLSDISQGAGPVDAGYVFPCVEPLLRYVQGEFYPWLAESFEIAEDYSYIMVYLRHGVKFHDGTDFTADAVKYNLDIARVHETYTQAWALESPEIIDDYTVKIPFKDGKWDWDAATGLGYWWGQLMYSPTAGRTHDSDWLKTHVIGTGPFILTEYIRDQKCSYDKNPDYWRGEPYVDGIDMSIIPDPTTQLLAYKAGELDTIGVQLKDIDRLKAEGFSILASEDMVFNYCLVPSSLNPDSPLSILEVRQAVQYAIDQESLIEGLSYGYANPSQQENCLEPYKHPDVVGYPYNPTEAMRLLGEAGYGDGITLTLSYAEGFGPPELPIALQAMFLESGITLELNKISYLQSASMIFGTGWDGFLFSFSMPGRTVDPGFTDGMFMEPGSWVSALHPPEIIALLDEAASEPDSAKRTALYQEISKMKADLCLNQYLYWVGSFTSISPFVTGYTIGEYSEFYAWTYAYYVD